MSYLPQFRNDVFLSYRRAQDEDPSPWVRQVHAQLMFELDRLLGPVEIWLDKLKLKDGDEWRTTIQRELEAAAIFVGIFSMTYMESDECRGELDSFLGWLKGPEGQNRRLVPVYVHPLGPEADVPLEVKERQRHEFFEPEPPPSTHFREFRCDAGDDVKAKFVAAVSRLAQDLKDALKAIKGLAPRPSAGTVFLARVKPELYESREQLRGELIQRGYTVIPEREYLWHSESFADQLAADLARADLCIHLVSRTGSSSPDAVPRARLQLTRAAAVMKARSLSPPLVWIRPSVGGPEDVEAGLLVGYVEKELANEGTEYCEASLEEFKTQIHDKLAAARPPVVPTAPGEVAVVAEDGDLTATQRLNAFLVESLKLEPRRLHFSGEAPRDPAAFARAVERCSHAVVFWGATSEEWVSNVLSLEPIAAKANAQRVCVYGASPATAEKETFRSGRAPLVLEPSTGVNEGDLRRFLALGRHTP